MDTDDPLRNPRGPLAWMARNAVAANLGMLLLIVGGLTMMPRVKQQVFPDFDLEVVEVSVAYPGASPEEVEQGVILAVEEAVRGLDGVKTVTSTATESTGTVSVELMLDTDVDRAVADVKAALDRITSFPADVETPRVKNVVSREIPVSLVVAGDVPEAVLRELAEQAREELLTDPRLTQVELRNPASREISIEVPQANLRAYGLTISQIAEAVRAASIELPGGGVKTRGGEVLLRTAERRQLAHEFEEVVVTSRPDGTAVRVRDLARVHDTFQEDGPVARYNGLPALMVDLYRVGDETPLEVAAALQEHIAEATPSLPPGVQLATWGQWAENYEGRVDLLLRNAFYGLGLVMLVLGSFLNVRLAFWVTMGIPISFIGSVLVFPAFDVSFNMISLFAFIIALGMVVDDAIVVGESVYHERQGGMRALDGAVVGVRRVGVPVVFSVTTTIVTFLPLLFVPGTSGKFLRNIPLIVIAVLAISLLESLFILPAHLAHTRMGQARGLLGAVERVQGRVSRGLERFVERVYQPVVRATTRRRYLTLAVAVTCLAATVGLVVGGRLKVVFMPQIERDMVDIQIQMPHGTPRQAMLDVVDRVVAASDRVVERHGGDAVLRKGMFTTVVPSTSFVSVSLEMPSIDVRALSQPAFRDAWREEVGEIAGVESMRFDARHGPAPSGVVEAELSHPRMDVLKQAAGELARRLGGYAGVTSVDDGFTRGKQQLDLTLRPEARSLGVTPIELGQQLRGSFFGQEALRQQRGRDELRVYVRRPRSERGSEYDLERFLVRTPDGGEVPLAVAADVERGRAYTEIKRKDGRRMVTVSAELDQARANLNEIVSSVQQREIPELMRAYPGLGYTRGGSSRSQDETLGSLGPNYILALIGIYMILAVVFRHYLQPLVVMSAIPFGFIGAIVGHFAMGYDLSLISMMGIVALSGVVVNDSLVLMVAVNEYRAQGMDAFEAVIAGGMRRFRPILLTSLTTFFGLVPMLTETSTQARFLIPMAISLAFGILFATVLILVAVPAGYVVLEDLQARARAAWRWIWPEHDGDAQPRAAE